MGLTVSGLLRNSTKIFAGGVASGAIAFLQGILLTRSLGPAEYGRWGLIVTFCTVTRAFLGFRTEEPLTRYWVEFKREGKRDRMRALLQTALITDFGVNCLVVLLTLAGFEIYGRISHMDPASFSACRIYAFCSLAVFAYAPFYSVARDAGFYGLMGFLPTFNVALQALGCAGLAWFHRLDVFSMAILYLGIAALHCGVNLFFLARICRRDLGMSLWALGYNVAARPFVDFKDFWKFMRVTYWGGTASAILKNGDTLLLGWLVDHRQVGIYRLAKSLISIIQSVGGSLFLVVYQDINEDLRAGRAGEIKRHLRRFLAGWIPLVAVMSLVAVITAKLAIVPLFGKEYAEAWLPFCILLVGTGVVLCLFWVQPMVLSSGKYADYLFAMAGAAVFAVVAMTVLIRYFQTTGAAAGYAMAWAGAHLALFLFARRIGMTPGKT